MNADGASRRAVDEFKTEAVIYQTAQMPIGQPVDKHSFSVTVPIKVL